MDFFGLMKELFSTIARFFTFRMTFNGFDFSIGSMIIGLCIIGCSLQLLRYLFDKD